MIKLPTFTASDFANAFNDTQVAFQRLIEQDFNILGGRTLRKEYQPNAITSLLQGVWSGGGAQTVHIGCGGGKSLIFNVAIAMALRYGKAKKIVVVAPTIVLTRQLETELIKVIASVCKAEHISRIKLRAVNVSSDGCKKVIDLNAEEVAAEQDDDSELDAQAVEEAVETASDFGIERHTTMNHDELAAFITDAMPTIFFVCKPSFIKNFSRRVIENRAMIDITVTDEYHNFISQNQQDCNRTLLQQYAAFSHNRWFFSATRKAGKLFSWYDPVFGKEVCNIKSSQLVDWGYLVPQLRIFFIDAGQIRGISEAVRDYFKSMKVAKPEKFFREVAVVLAMMQRQLQLSVPQAIMFGSSVKFIKEMMRSDEFKSALEGLVEGLYLRHILGDTPKADREVIFTELREAADTMATCLLNHSCIKEGVDVAKFNTALITRGMSEHGLQQALGRIQRKYDGKATAYLYLYIDGDSDDAVKEKARDIALKLHYNIGDLNPVYEDLFDSRVGEDGGDEQQYIKMGDIKIPLLKTTVNIAEQVVDAIAAAKADEEYVNSLRKYAAIPMRERMMMAGAF
jgi:superfamily II DNA or RNA helicase